MSDDEPHTPQSTPDVDEERFAAALKASDLGVFEFLPDENTAFWDDKVRQLWGIPAGEHITYETVVGQVHADDRDHHNLCTEQSLDPAGSGEMDMEYRVLPRDGSAMRWIRAKATCTFDGDKPVRLLGTVQDVTERREYLDRNTLLISELQHRVKNTLATVISVIKLSKMGNESLDTYADALEDRLLSMAETHNTLSKNQWQHIGIESILKREFDAFTNPGKVSFSFSGPNLKIPARNVQVVSMAIHELLTNASKHGALTSSNGTVVIETGLENGSASFAWQERGGPRCERNAKPDGGFGSFLLSQVLRAELKADIEYLLKPGGAFFKMRFPLKAEADQ